VLSAAVVELNRTTGKTTRISRLQLFE